MLGDSILYWAGKRAEVRDMASLKLPGNVSIGWKGIRGMRWGDFHHVVQRELLFTSKQPRIIVIYLGGNDFETTSLFKLKRTINREINFLYSVCSEKIIV
jgi:hypothetical protein